MYIVSKVGEKFDRTITPWYVGKVIKSFRNLKWVCRPKDKKVSQEKARRIERVLEYIAENPKSSIRNASHELRIPKSNIQQILKEEKIIPYKPTDVQQLYREHMIQRVEFCHNFMAKNLDIHKIFFSDEKIFCLSRRENHQNSRYWSAIRPEDFVNEIEPHSPSLHVWCALSSSGIIGPYFLEGRVDQFEYQKMVDLYFVEELKKNFGQDGQLDPTLWFQ